MKGHKFHVFTSLDVTSGCKICKHLCATPVRTAIDLSENLLRTLCVRSVAALMQTVISLEKAELREAHTFVEPNATQ